MYCTLIIMSYPSMSTVVATLLLAFGKPHNKFLYFAFNKCSGCLFSAWVAQDIGFQCGSVILLVLPFSAAGLFTITSMPITKEQEGHNEHRSLDSQEIRLETV